MTYAWEEENRPGNPCPGCSKRSAARTEKGKRALSIGCLRTDVVLYHETDHRADKIGDIVAFDLASRPDLLIVIGTSLLTDGVKKLVKDLSRYEKGGKPYL